MSKVELSCSVASDSASRSVFSLWVSSLNGPFNSFATNSASRSLSSRLRDSAIEQQYMSIVDATRFGILNIGSMLWDVTTSSSVR